MNGGDKNIVLIGFMGVGKTTVGRILADMLSWEFVDSDHLIEQRYRLPITEIFRKYGEAEFRSAERRTVEELCTAHERKIISLGGGAYAQEPIRKVCMRHCIVVYLDLSWRQWQRRRSLLVESRPMLQSRTDKEIRELFETRKQYYAHHHMKVRTDGLNSEKVAQLIRRRLKAMRDQGAN